jgi:hypothetical protein
MKNENERQIARFRMLSGPTHMCFNFFNPPHKNFEILPAYIAHPDYFKTKAPQANAATKALPKRAILPTHKRNFDGIQ